MKRLRIKSKESGKYHRPGCKYTNQIYKRNRIELSFDEAKEFGFKPCRHCNNMSFLYQRKIQKLDWYKENRKMDYLFQDGMLYIKTEMGCWKIVYSRGLEEFALYHRNGKQKPLDFAHPENDRYHRQKDRLYFRDIEQILEYIYEHDKFRSVEKQGCRITYKNKKYKKQAKKRKERAALRRVDRLFEKLEKENEEYRAYSFC